MSPEFANWFQVVGSVRRGSIPFYLTMPRIQWTNVFVKSDKESSLVGFSFVVSGKFGIPRRACSASTSQWTHQCLNSVAPVNLVITQLVTFIMSLSKFSFDMLGALEAYSIAIADSI